MHLWPFECICPLQTFSIHIKANPKYLYRSGWCVCVCDESYLWYIIRRMEVKHMFPIWNFPPHIHFQLKFNLFCSFISCDLIPASVWNEDQDQPVTTEISIHIYFVGATFPSQSNSFHFHLDFCLFHPHLLWGWQPWLWHFHLSPAAFPRKYEFLWMIEPAKSRPF